MIAQKTQLLLGFNCEWPARSLEKGENPDCDEAQWLLFGERSVCLHNDSDNNNAIIATLLIVIKSSFD